VTDVDEDIDLVETMKEVLVAPAGTVTLCGTVAAFVLLLESDITAPPEGAAALSVTVPCEKLPPVTLVGFNVSDDSTGTDERVGVGVNVAVVMGVEVGVLVNVGVGVFLEPGVEVGVGVVLVVTVVTWLAELLALFESNSCPETNASLRRLPVA